MQNIESFVSHEIYERLIEYNNLLLKWNNTINLISFSTVHEAIQRHIIDSLQLLRFIKNKNISIIDLGSGAGLPGIVLSIAGVAEVTLIESDSRKSSFLMQAAKLSTGNIKVINDRLENLQDLECDIVTARAFTSLAKILEFGSKIKVADKYLLHKGKTYREEIAKSEKHWLFNSKVHDSITSDYGKILEITNVTNIS